MYESDLIIKEIQADKLMALLLDKAVIGVEEQTLESITRIDAAESADRLKLQSPIYYHARALRYSDSEYNFQHDEII